MDKIFSSLKNLTKISDVVIDSNISRLHYKFTVLILLAFSILVSTKQYIGDPIDCISKDDIPHKLLDTFCWIHATFSVVGAWEKEVGEQIPYPGVDKYTKDENRVYHAYYQWVCFVLFLQAVMFYMPHYLWKAWEGGRIKALILGLNNPIAPTEQKDTERESLINYLVLNRGSHNFFAAQFLFCEALNFVNVIGQMYLLNTFLGGEFTSYGMKVIEFTGWNQELRYDPMIHVFPRMTKCTFHRYGSSGDVQRHDAMCILPINIVNEKIFIFLWFWFILLSALSALILAYHFAVFVSLQARFFLLKKKARLARSDYIHIILRRSSLSDWFLLDLLGKNMDAINFKDVIADLALKLEQKAGNIE